MGQYTLLDIAQCKTTATACCTASMRCQPDMFLFNSSNSIGTTVPAPVYAAQPTPASRSKFDPLNYLRSKTTDGGESVTVGRKMQTVIPVRKPSKQQFVHAHPSPDYRPDGQPDAASIAPPSSPASTQGASLPQSKGVVHG